MKVDIDTIKSRKASGNGGLVIHVDLLKVADDVVTNGITTIFTKVLRNDEIPKNWTTATKFCTFVYARILFTF